MSMDRIDERGRRLLENFARLLEPEEAIVPIEVIFDGTVLHVLDGRHRLLDAVARGKRYIPAVITLTQR